MDFLPQIRSQKQALVWLSLVAGAIYGLIALLENGFYPLFPPRCDLAVHIPIVLHFQDPTRYAPNDPLFSEYLQLFPAAYARLLSLFPDFRLPLIVLSALLSAVLVGGTYGLSLRITKNRTWSVLIALLTLRPWPALYSMQWGGILPEYAVPRHLVIAFSPWLFWAMISWKTFKQRIILAVVMGCACNFHPMLAQLLLVWLVGIFWKEWRQRAFLVQWKELTVLGGTFILFALPTLLPSLQYSWNGLTGGMQAVDRPAPMPERMHEMNRISLPAMAAIVFYFIPFAFLSLAGILTKKRQDVDQQNLAMIAFLFFVSVGFQIVGYFRPTWSFGELQRLFGYLYLFAFIYAYFGLAWIATRRRQVAIVITLFLLFHHGSTYRIVLGHLAPDSSIGRLFAKAPRRTWVSEGFLRLAQFAKKETPRDAVFLVPPRGMSSLWRIDAERSILVHWEGLYSATGMEIFREVEAAYQEPESAELYEVAKKYRTRYVLTEKPLAGEMTAQLPKLVCEGSYCLYEAIF